MDDDRKKIWVMGDQLGNVGSIVGATAGATLGLEGAIAGGIAGMIAGRGLSKHVFDTNPQSGKLTSSLISSPSAAIYLHQKLRRDIKLLTEHNEASNLRHYFGQLSECNGQLAKLINEHRESMLAHEIFDLNSVKEKKFEHLKEATVACSPVYSGIYASFLSLKETLAKEDIQVHLNCNNVYGRDLFFGENSFDFILAPLDVLVLQALNHRTRYSLTSLLSFETQRMYLKRLKSSWGKTAKVNVFSGSSGQMYGHLGAVLPRSTEVLTIEDEKVWLPTLLDDIEGGDYVMSWDVMRNSINKNGNFDIVPGSEYKVWVGLFSHSSVSKRDGSIFAKRLKLEMKKTTTCQNQYFFKLFNNKEYMKAFKKSVGFDS